MVRAGCGGGLGSWQARAEEGRETSQGKTDGLPPRAAWHDQPAGARAGAAQSGGSCVFAGIGGTGTVTHLRRAGRAQRLHPAVVRPKRQRLALASRASWRRGLLVLPEGNTRNGCMRLPAVDSPTGYSSTGAAPRWVAQAAWANTHRFRFGASARSVASTLSPLRAAMSAA